jgi:hypothetical protein
VFQDRNRKVVKGAQRYGAKQWLGLYQAHLEGSFAMFANVTIQGVSPLLCNRFTDEAQMVATSGSRPAGVGQQGSPKEQAEKKLYKDESGKLIIPGPNLMSCITEAGKFFKAGRAKVTTQKSSLIPACVWIQELCIPLKSKDSWGVDTRPVRIPATGGRILCHRPCFHDWELVFSLEIDTELMTKELLRQIVDAAGKRIGLGDFRPDRKGPFGRFVVNKWKIS